MEDFLDSLDSKQAKKLIWVMSLLENMNQVSNEYFKKLNDSGGIWEVRAQLGSNAFRILGFHDHMGRVVLTNGFRKKSQKIPFRELDKAVQRKADYRRRNEQ